MVVVDSEHESHPLNALLRRCLDGDRADFRYRVAFDRATGILLCVEEFRGETLMRSACVTAVGIDEQISASEFTIELPAGTIPLY